LVASRIPEYKGSKYLAHNGNINKTVARIERSEIRGVASKQAPDFAALYPGYEAAKLKTRAIPTESI
jgi:hypothetical protein